MALVVPNSGEAEMLSRILGNATGDVVLHLYNNDYTPLEGSTVGDFAENSEGEYSAKTLAAGSWTISGDPTTATYNTEQEFAVTSGGISAYGYFVTDSGGTILLWAERFVDGLYDVPSAGSIYITPKIQLD